MWGNQNPHTMLVGVKNGAANVENRRALTQII